MSDRLFHGGGLISIDIVLPRLIILLLIRMCVSTASFLSSASPSTVRPMLVGSRSSTMLVCSTAIGPGLDVAAQRRVLIIGSTSVGGCPLWLVVLIVLGLPFVLGLLCGCSRRQGDGRSHEEQEPPTWRHPPYPGTWWHRVTSSTCPRCYGVVLGPPCGVD